MVLESDCIRSTFKTLKTNLFNATQEELVKNLMENDKCSTQMMELQSDLMFIKISILLLLVFFGIKSTDAVEKGSAKYMKIFKIITFFWIFIEIGANIFNTMNGFEISQIYDFIDLLSTMYMFVIFNSLQFKFKGGSNSVIMNVMSETTILSQDSVQ